MEAILAYQLPLASQLYPQNDWTATKVRRSHLIESCFTKFTQNKHHLGLLPSFLLSLQDQDTLLGNFLTVSPLYQEPQISTVSYLEQLLCESLNYLLMFNKKVQSMFSFSNPILKYKPSTILLCFLFCSSFLDFFSFFFLSLPFLLVMPHTSHLQERSLTSIGLRFLQSCLNICLWSLKVWSHPKSCELWRIRTGPISGSVFSQHIFLYIMLQRYSVELERHRAGRKLQRKHSQTPASWFWISKTNLLVSVRAFSEVTVILSFLLWGRYNLVKKGPFLTTPTVCANNSTTIHFCK